MPEPFLVLRRGVPDLEGVVHDPLDPEAAVGLDFDLVENERGRGGELSDGTVVYVRPDGSAEVRPPAGSGRWPRVVHPGSIRSTAERATIAAIAAAWRLR